MSGPCERVANRIAAGLPPRSMISALHGECAPYEPYEAYGARLKAACDALQQAAGVTCWQNIGYVLRRTYYSDREAMIRLLRRGEAIWREAQTQEGGE